VSRTFRPLFPGTKKQVCELGDRIRLARLRRRITASLFAERVGVSRDTLHRLEKGDATIALGTWARALRVLGLDRDLDAVARDDVLGRKLQDLGLEPRRRRRGHDGNHSLDPTQG
jgi:transcriptional regulator with XRE-family HTH domain